MKEGDDLLRAIADAGGIDPVDFLRRMVDPAAPNHLVDSGGALMWLVVDALQSDMTEETAREIKALLWDARSATLAARDLTDEERTRRTEVIDEIGGAVFPQAAHRTGRGSRVEVNATDLATALRALHAASPRTRIYISFKQDQLEFVGGQALVRVPAVGTWPVTARLEAAFVTELLSRSDALPQSCVISATDTMLHISHFSFPCRWRER